MKRVGPAVLVAVAMLASVVGAAQAAAPRIVIVTGASLDRRVVISDWNEIATIVRGVATTGPVRDARLTARPRLSVAMFWGPRWSEYLASGKPASALRPRQAETYGVFYPAWRGRRAVIDLSGAGLSPRLVSAKALVILERYGIPIQLT